LRQKDAGFLIVPRKNVSDITAVELTAISIKRPVSAINPEGVMVMIIFFILK